MVSRGFAMAEVVVALVVLAAGLTGAVGLSVSAREIFIRAEIRETVVWEARSLADSLLSSGTAGSGFLPRPWGGFGWSAGRSGWVAVVRLQAELASAPGDTLVFETARLVRP